MKTVILKLRRRFQFIFGLILMTASGGGFLVQAAGPEVTFKVSSHTNHPGQAVAAQITVRGFTNVTSAQFTLQWDPAVVRFQNLGGFGLPDMSAGNFGTLLTNSGKLTFSWDDPTVTGVNATDGTAIFSVNFVVVGAPGTVSPLALVDAPTPREVAVNLTTASFISVNGEVRVPGAEIAAVTFQLSSHSNQPGQAVAAQVSVRGFTNVTSAQFTLQWDPSVVRYQSLAGFGLPDLSAGNFGTLLTNSGKLTFSWDDPTVVGVNLADGTVVFAVNYLVVGAGGAVSPLALVDVPTPREVAVNLTPATFLSVNGEIRVAAGTPPSITLQPANTTVEVGASASFTVGASGSPPLSYSWRRNGNPIAGANDSSYTLNNAQLSDSGAWFSCLVSNPAGTVLSDAALLTVVSGNTVTYSNSSLVTLNDNAAGKPYPSVITIAGQAGTVRKVTATVNGLSHSFPHDVGILLLGPLGQAVVLLANAGGGQGINDVTLTFDDEALMAFDEYCSITNGGYRPSPCGTADLFPAPAPGPPYDTALLAFKGRNPNGNWSLYAHDDASGDQGLILRGWSLTLTVEVPLQITQQPASQTVIAGHEVEFVVAATGAPPLGYAWRFHGTNLAPSARITGVASPKLRLANISAGDAGPYDVVVTNSSSSVVSATAWLTVLPFGTPYIVAGSSQYLPGSGFQCLLGGATGSNYEIQVSSDFVTWKRSGILVMTNDVNQFRDTTTGLARRFYRAKLMP